MTRLPATVIDSIAKMLPRLATTHDAEVVATARAMQRTLASAGADLHDVVALIEAGSAASRPRTELGHVEVIALAEKLLDRRRCDLNNVETQFVRDMRAAAKRFKSKLRISPKQADWLRQLAKDYLDLEPTQ
ncbi:MAG: hypothetical protein J0H54_05590 [Rhizobiales bacterium]|nr:hypothetical protein [Hyphomicrobiales bacterium]